MADQHRAGQDLALAGRHRRGSRPARRSKRDEQRALERAERERAAVDRPVVHTDVQAGSEAHVDGKAEADQDADLEI
jgi:hypothetical protein